MSGVKELNVIKYEDKECGRYSFLGKLRAISILCGNSCSLWPQCVTLAFLPGRWGPGFLHQIGMPGLVLNWAELKAGERLGEIVLYKWRVG